MKDNVHFYHLWLGGRWRDVLSEHLTALKDSYLADELVIKVGVVDPNQLQRKSRLKTHVLPKPRLMVSLNNTL